MGVSFVFWTNRLKNYVAFKKYRLDKVKDPENLIDRLEKIFNEDNLLDKPYSSTSFIFLTQKSTLVPSEFFDESKIKDFFEFNQTLDDLDELNYNYIPAIDAYNIFAIPNYIANHVYDKFRNIKFYHQATPFIQSLVNGFEEQNGVHINLNHDFFDIGVIENSALKFYNTFKFLNDTDLLYFIMFVVNQLKIDIQSSLFTVCGESVDKPVLIEALNKYLPNLSYLEPVYPDFSDIFKKLSCHKYFNLFYLANCE
ncbi:MAG: DUF3822 family protein [Bacteroidales bacterium]|nr:DUF3822 family protein [Bacteroidales bacterium]